MLRKVYKESVNWVACSFSIFCLLFIGHASANKEGYYGKYIGKLSQLHHGVSGDVFAVDARTLHIRNFNYDGEGPAAYFYAGNSKAPGVNGFRLRDERGTTNVLPRYRNKHITVTLPEGRNLQNIRWFSVWCDEFSVNFGDVKIPKNLDFPKPQKIAGLSGVHGVSSEPIVIVDAQTLLIPSFSYDGEAPDAKFWVGRGFKPSPQGIRIPDENGKELPLRRYDRKTIVLTLPGDLTIFDIGHFGVWCEAFTVDFGHVQIPRGLNIPPSLKMLGVSPQSKLNCEVLWDDFAYEVRWAVAGDSIVLQLVARLEDNEYMSFGISGDQSRSRMVGGDVVVAWVDKDSLKGYAKDYYLDAKSQCSGGRGSCPDENIEAGTDSVRLLNAALVNGYSIVTFQRSLKAQDDLDKDVFINASQPIVWAVGPLNSRKEVSYHSLANRGDIYIDFGRAPKWNCPTPEATSDPSESEDPSTGREQEAKIEDSRIQADPNRRESRPKSPIPTPAPAPKSGAWEIPSIKCYEPEDGVFYAQMGPTGGKHGYSAITGHVGWGISWYVNGLLIPEINVVRGRTYTFIVEGGLDPETPARYHPFYITDDPVGGYQYKTPQERANIQIFAGAVQNKRGEVRPTGVGRLCNWTPDPNAPPADEFSSFGAYQRTLRLECDPGNPGIIQWTVEKDTPDTVYYQCYTHRYLGWKINVHDHCEGEAASNPVPSIVKAPPSVVEDFEVDPEGSESINYETRVKPDAELLKSILEKNQTNFGLNQLVGHVSTNKFHPEFFSEREKIVFQNPKQQFHFPQAGIPLRQQNVFQTPFLQEKTSLKISSLTVPAKPSGYSVTEEPSEGIQENFQIIPIQGPFISGLQNHQQLSSEAPLRLPEQVKVGDKFQYGPSRDAPRPQVEEKPKRKNQKPPFHSKGTGRLPGGPSRLRKPPPANPLTLQQRPLPPGVFRPPALSPKPHSRPLPLGSSSSTQHLQTKSQKPLLHFNFPLGLESLNRQEIQPLRQVERPNKNQKIPPFTLNDSFGSSTVNRPSSQVISLAQNNGFDPLSVQVEGGFKPILNTGIAPQSSLLERSDVEMTGTADDGIGVIDLITTKDYGEARVKKTEEGADDDKTEIERSRDKKIDLFKDQKPQTFEPIFIPSHPDDSIKKYPEKPKKKPLNLKPRHDQFKRIGEEIRVKIRPVASVFRRPLYPDNVVPPFRIPQQGKTPQLRSHQSQDSNDRDSTRIEDTSVNAASGNSKAENILEVLEMYEEKNNKTSTTESQEFSPEEKIKSHDIVQDEIAMADDRKEFYLPPKADEFLSYDGKVVKAVEAPTLPRSSPRADLSKLPQFGPFTGVKPPLSQEINAESLPQLRSRTLARHDILPPATSVSEALHFQNHKTHERKKRAPDHIPGHEGHDHSHDNHHHHHNSGSSNASHLFRTAFIAFTLMCLQRHAVL